MPVTLKTSCICFSSTPTQLDGDEIQLQRPDPVGDIEGSRLEKFTFSNALSLSVKLSIWEASLERYADSIEWILQDLKEGKKIGMTRGDILRKSGELFTLRCRQTLIILYINFDKRLCLSYEFP